MINNVFDLLLYNFDKKKDNIAIKTDAIHKSYAEMLYDINVFSSKLRKIGLKKNNRIGIYLPNSYAFTVTFFSLQKIGCTVILINYENWIINLKHIIQDSNLDYIITADEKMNELYNLPDCPVLNFQTINLSRIAIKDIQNENKELHTAIPDDVSLIIYTSGSTGFSKGVILTHANVVAGTKIVANYLQINEHDILLGLLPFSFDYGLNQLLTVILRGASIFIKYPISFFEIPSVIDNNSITGFAGVPSIWINLVGLLGEKKVFKSLRYITNSGGAIPQIVLDKLQNAFSFADVFLMYGLTECYRCSFLKPSSFQRKKGSIGKAIPGCEIMIVNENNKLCQVGEIGQLVFRGPTVGKGYLNCPEETRLVFRKNPFNSLYSETVIYSGDYAYVDDDGYYYFVGRKDGQLKKNGYRFNVQTIENEIYRCKDVIECCILSKKNKNNEDDLYLFIKAENKQNTDDLKKKIYLEVINNMPNYMHPQRIIFLDEIPKQYNSKYSYVELNRILDKATK